MKATKDFTLYKSVHRDGWSWWGSDGICRFGPSSDDEYKYSRTKDNLERFHVDYADAVGYYLNAAPGLLMACTDRAIHGYLEQDRAEEHGQACCQVYRITKGFRLFELLMEKGTEYVGSSDFVTSGRKYGARKVYVVREVPHPQGAQCWV